MKFYELTEAEHLEMLMNGKKFSRNELRDLIDMYDFKTIEGEDRRWQRTKQSFLKIKEKYFVIIWEEGLTEKQENDYDNQPYEVIKKETKILIPEHYETKVEWKKV